MKEAFLGRGILVDIPLGFGVLGQSLTRPPLWGLCFTKLVTMPRLHVWHLLSHFQLLKIKTSFSSMEWLIENKTTLKDVWLILLQTKVIENIIIVEAWTLIKDRNIKNNPNGYKMNSSPSTKSYGINIRNLIPLREIWLCKLWYPQYTE